MRLQKCLSIDKFTKTSKFKTITLPFSSNIMSQSLHGRARFGDPELVSDDKKDIPVDIIMQSELSGTVKLPHIWNKLRIKRIGSLPVALQKQVPVMVRKVVAMEQLPPPILPGR